MRQHEALLGLLLVSAACGPGEAPRRQDALETDSTRADRERVVAFWAEYRKGTDARVAGRLEEAATQYRRALAHDPNHEDALYYLGALSLELGNFDDAESAWRRLVTVNPATPRGHMQLGRLYMCAERGRVDFGSAQAELERAAAINREQTGPWIHLGQLALATGDTTAAQRHFSHVLASNPSSIPANYFVGFLAWRAGKTSAALDAFSTAVGSARPTAQTAPAPGEGDTKSGASPLLAEKNVCADFDEQYANLGSVDSARLATTMAARYSATRAWLARRSETN